MFSARKQLAARVAHAFEFVLNTTERFRRKLVVRRESLGAAVFELERHVEVDGTGRASTDDVAQRVGEEGIRRWSVSEDDVGELARVHRTGRASGGVEIEDV